MSDLTTGRIPATPADLQQPLPAVENDRPVANRETPRETSTDELRVCPRWGDLGHNWIVINGWLPWRRYRVCCACYHEERVK